MVRALAFMLPAGHSPAFAFEAIAINPMVVPASTTPCRRACAFNLNMVFLLCGEPHHGVDRSGLVDTILEIGRTRKCLLALVFIALRYAAYPRPSMCLMSAEKDG